MYKNSKILDYLLMPLLIIILLAEPNMLKGVLDRLEMGHYLSAADGVFAGKVPFKEFFFFFGPLQLYLIVIVMSLFGKTIAVLKMFFYINYILSFLAVYLLAMNVYKNRFFAYMMSIVCVVEASHPFWATSFDYGRMGLGLIILVLLIRFARKENVKMLLAAGSASAVALIYTVDVGVFSIIAFTAFILVYNIDNGFKNLRNPAHLFFKDVIYYIIGISVVIVPFFLFLASNGGLLPYLKTTFYIIPKYHMKVWGQPVTPFPWSLAQDPFLLLRSYIFKIYFPVLIYASTLIYLLYCFLKKKWSKGVSIIFLLFIYGLLVYKTSFRAMMGPQFIVSLPPTIILTGIFLEKAFNAVTEKANTINNAKRNVKIAVAAMMIFTAAICFIGFPINYYGTLSGWIRYQIYKKHLSATWTGPALFDEENFVKPHIAGAGNIMVPKSQAEEMEGVVSYLREHTENNEEVLAFPEYSLYNFLSERPSFSRFYISGSALTTPEWKTELFNELVTKKPKVILRSTHISVLARSIGSHAEILPSVVEFIDKNYHIVKKFSDIVIYEKNK